MPATKDLQAFRTLTSQGYDLKYEGFFHSQWKARKMLSSARSSGSTVSAYTMEEILLMTAVHTL